MIFLKGIIAGITLLPFQKGECENACVVARGILNCNGGKSLLSFRSFANTLSLLKREKGIAASILVNYLTI